MKKLLIILSIGLVSCFEPNIGYPVSHDIPTDTTKKDTIQHPTNIEVEFSDIPLTVVVVDSCEYLYGPWGNATVFTHKGNCKNLVHKKIQRYTDWKN